MLPTRLFDSLVQGHASRGQTFWRNAAFALAIAALIPTSASAAEIALIGSVAFKGPLDILIPEFTKATGHHVTIWLAAGPALARQIDSGAPCDVVVVVTPQFDGLVKSGAAQPGSGRTLGSLDVELAYPANAPKPDISTPEKLKALVLSAHAISSSDPALGGASALYFQTVATKLGIADAANAKLIKTPSGDGPKPVAAGKAEIGFGMSSEVADAPGTAGEPLDPTDPKSKITLVAATMTKAQDAAAANALVAFLATPKAAEVIRRKGFTTP